MTGPSWLGPAFAAAMMVTAVYCAGRLAAARLWRRATEVDADALHAVMGVAMAGMLLPRLSLVPGAVWVPVFGTAAVWFGSRVVRGPRRTAPGSRRWSAHPVPHLAECAAMIYMLMAAGGQLILAMLLALFMAGYVLWTADQLTSLARAPAVTGGAAPGPAVTGGAAPGPSVMGSGAPGPAVAVARGPVLAPALAACSKIAMGIAMGYMLLAML